MRPTPTHQDPKGLNLFGQPYVTVGQALAGLPEPSPECIYPTLHFAPEHEPEVIERFIRLSEGERDHKRRRNRLHADRPAFTLFAGGPRGGTRTHIHPDYPRELTPRECARIHGFPDDFRFAGNKSMVAIQIANSVPIPVGAAWGRHLFNLLTEATPNT